MGLCEGVSAAVSVTLVEFPPLVAFCAQYSVFSALGPEQQFQAEEQCVQISLMPKQLLVLPESCWDQMKPFL